MENVHTHKEKQKLGMSGRILVIWIILALVGLYPAAALLKSSFPIFTVAWLAAPLLVLGRSRQPALLGFRLVPLRLFLWVTLVNLGVLLGLMALFEPWSHTYRTLVNLVTVSQPPDPTFAWLIRFGGLAGWGGMLVFSALVTLFAEELFFRGWLLQLLLRRMRPVLAVVIQAALFTLPQLIAALLLPPLQGVLYALVYSWLSIGVVGGWAAWRSRSIWPSLVSAVLCNLVLTILVF